jgi:alpha 1,6-mannosyltransferase
MMLTKQPCVPKIYGSIAILAICTILYFWTFWPWHQWPHFTAPTSVFMAPVFTEPPLRSAIPEKIWYKVGPKGISKQSQEWIDSCLQRNPTYQSEVLTDLSGDEYVKNDFAWRPQIVDTFLSLSVPILKADFLRYLLLYSDGGIWTDLDISCEDVPMQDWVPDEYKRDASLVVGWEFDVGWGENFVREFATWTMMAKPGSPHMLMVIEDILEGLHQKTLEHNVTISELTMAIIGDIVDITGPRRFTRSVMKSLEAVLGHEIDQRNITNIFEPVLVEDVLILPGYAFANSSNHYTELQSPLLVTHHFAGSWKNDHGGEMA